MAKKISKEEQAWQVRNDLETLRRADEIKANARRFAAVQKEAKAQIKSINAITKKK